MKISASAFIYRGQTHFVIRKMGKLQDIGQKFGISGAGGGTRTLTHSRAADFESAASAISPLRQKTNGAGEGNRTLVASLEGWSSAIELRPLNKKPSVLRMAHCLSLFT